MRKFFRAPLALFCLFYVSILYGAAGTGKKTPLAEEIKYRDKIVAAAQRHGLDPELVLALISSESRHNPQARGSRGEIGLMQIRPGRGGAVSEWARATGRRHPTVRELYDVNLNLEIGCWYLARAIRRWRRYNDHVALALVQYNAGASRAKECAPKSLNGRVLPRIRIASTRSYVETVLKRYWKYLVERTENRTAGVK